MDNSRNNINRSHRRSSTAPRRSEAESSRAGAVRRSDTNNARRNRGSRKESAKKEPKMSLGKRIASYFLSGFGILILNIGFILFMSTFWILKQFGDLSIYEIVFTMSDSLKGAANVGTLVKSYLLMCGIAEVLFLIVSIWVVVLLRTKGRIRISPVVVMTMLGLMMGMWTYIRLNHTYKIQEYVQSYDIPAEKAPIKENYTDATTADIVFPEKKRNLIYIFLESMEMTYSDVDHGGAFSDDYLPNLTQLALENECFSGHDGQLNGGVTMEGSTWTTGAVFSQTSGIPLISDIGGNSYSTQDSMFPSLTTLGDMLQYEGYKNYYYCSNEAQFGGIQLYLTTHGQYEIFDWQVAADTGYIPDGYYVWWGFEDELMFPKAKEKLEELGQSDEPFNFTMITCDTHFEDGYVCDLCENNWGDQYANVISCSDRQVSSFIKWIMEQDFYENTTIVISGDHLTMDSDFCAYVPDSYQRRVYTCIINPAVQPENDTRRQFTTLDMYPTVLGALGVQIKDNRLGLGTNLFSSVPTLIEELGYDGLSERIRNSSTYFKELSGIGMNETVVDRLHWTTAIGLDTDYDGNTVFAIDTHEEIDCRSVSEVRVEFYDPGSGELAYTLYPEQVDTSERYSRFESVVDADSFAWQTYNVKMYFTVRGEEFEVYAEDGCTLTYRDSWW